MNKDDLLRQLQHVEALSTASKWSRLVAAPARYMQAMLFRHLQYRYSKKERMLTTPAFFGIDMTIALPAATDIFLTGGKSHISEIKLARFLIANLNEGDHFLDIGAHYGYFSLLAAMLVGDSGIVHSFEPASDTYALLSVNADRLKRMYIHKSAVANEVGSLTFYEFPNLYSEYNTTNVSQFEQEDWFREFGARQTTVPTTTIDRIVADYQVHPKIVKIDVEGAEFAVISGASRTLSDRADICFAMEYLHPDRHNEEHQKAHHLLKDHGYEAHIINKDGSLEPVADIDVYLIQNKLQSDNIVFTGN